MTGNNIKIALLNIFICWSLNSCNSQLATINDNESIYIYDSNPIINSDEIGNLHYILSVNNDKSESDAYKFIIPNRVGLNKYLGLGKIGKDVSIDTLKYLEKKNFQKESLVKIHNFFSYHKKMYLIRPKTKSSDKHIIYPLSYKGTEKNLHIMKL